MNDVDGIDDDPDLNVGLGDPDCTEDDRPMRLRAAWIAAVRLFHVKRTGKSSYYNSNTHWDGGYDRRTGKTIKSKWPGIVSRANALGADPVSLVEVLFESLTSDTVPSPYAIVSTENVERLRRRAHVIVDRVREAVAAEETVFRAALWAADTAIPDPKEAIRFALNDIGRSMSPLFRYSLATRTGNYDIAERWTRSAIDQFCKSPDAYIRYWAHILPMGRDLEILTGMPS